MRRYYIVSGILLIIPIALAAPVLVQEKRQVGVDAVHIPEDATAMLGKRGDDLTKVFTMYEEHFAKQEESSAAHPSSSLPPSGPDHEWTGVEKPPPPSPESVGAHAPPNPGPSTESNDELTGAHAPLSSPVFPTWFLSDHGYWGPHAPQPSESDKLVAEEPPSRPESPTGFDADDEYHVVHPPPPSPGSASPTESDHEMIDAPPPSPVPSTNPGRRSRGTDSRLENLQAVSDALKGDAKESRRISGTARDVLNVAQAELQHERSPDHGE
jgi:hypothetical protein